MNLPNIDTDDIVGGDEGNNAPKSKSKQPRGEKAYGSEEGFPTASTSEEAINKSVALVRSFAKNHLSPQRFKALTPILDRAKSKIVVLPTFEDFKKLAITSKQGFTDIESLRSRKLTVKQQKVMESRRLNSLVGFVFDSDGDPTIALYEGAGSSRRIETITHEIGHFVFDSLIKAHAGQLYNANIFDRRGWGGDDLADGVFGKAIVLDPKAQLKFEIHEALAEYVTRLIAADAIGASMERKLVDYEPYVQVLYQMLDKKQLDKQDLIDYALSRDSAAAKRIVGAFNKLDLTQPTNSKLLETFNQAARIRAHL